MGIGDKTWFWEDTWVGSTQLAALFPRLYRVSTNSYSLIASLVCWNSENSYSWDLSFRTDLNDREIDEFLGLMIMVGKFILSRSDRDQRIWVGKSRVPFLVNPSLTY